jgi:glutamine synthetase
MNTVDGYAISSWERGYGDMEFVLDLATLHPVPWIPGTAMVICDLVWLDEAHSPVVESPRQVLRAQVDRATQQGLVAFAGTELEFIVFNDTYEQAWDLAYRGLTPANQYNVDYSLLGTSRVEPLLRDIRNGMFAAGLVVESAKGECNLGQHEIAFKFDEVIRTGDHHSIYKNGAKEIAAHHGKALTFMAKFDQREGNSCHIHMSLRGDDGRIVFDDGDGPTPMFQSFVAGIQATMCELTFLYAPNINSYKRFQPGSFAPTSTAWGYDNRTCSLRVVGHGAGLRLENRLPGGDVNPYLAMAGMLGSGLRGIELGLPLEPAFEGNAYTSDHPRVPTSLQEARDLFAASPVARELLGDEVVDHYTNYADVELAAFGAAVTDWERFRGFERL